MKSLCATVLSLALLGGCGGVSQQPEESMATPATVTTAATATAIPATATRATPTPTALNFAEEPEQGPGDRANTPASDPAAMPADHAARTRPGLYLRRADAERWERRLRGDVVWLDAGCCAGDEAEMALLIAYGMQAAKNLGNDAPFFVSGSDQRLAATLVNRLAETGSPQAFLVTP